MLQSIPSYSTVGPGWELLHSISLNTALWPGWALLCSISSNTAWGMAGHCYIVFPQTLPIRKQMQPFCLVMTCWNLHRPFTERFPMCLVSCFYFTCLREILIYQVRKKPSFLYPKTSHLVIIRKYSRHYSEPCEEWTLKWVDGLSREIESNFLNGAGSPPPHCRHFLEYFHTPRLE